MSNVHALVANPSRELGASFGDVESSCLVSGGIPVASGTTTVGAHATIGYIEHTDGSLIYVSQASSTIGPLSGGDGTYWLALHTDLYSTVGGWTRQTGTHYLWIKSATRPAAPTNGVIYGRVVVTASAVASVADTVRRRLLTNTLTFAASMTIDAGGVWVVRGGSVAVNTGVTVTCNASVEAGLQQWITLTGTGKITFPYLDVVHPEWWGAVADNATDNVAPITAALAGVASRVVFAAGTYLSSASIYCTTSNLTLEGDASGGTIIKATAGASLGHGLLTIGYSGAATIAVSDIEVSRLTLDATSKNRAIFCISTTRGYFHHNVFKNGASGVAYFSVTTDCQIVSNYITGAGNADQYGDGLYVEKATDIKILFNRIHSFYRIGIVIEGDGTTKSTNPLIMGNEISHAITSTAPEYNAGIWLENTNHGRVVSNRMTDLYNSPSTNVVGIVVSIGASGTDNFYVIRDNVIADVDYGVWINTTSSSAHFDVQGNSILAGSVHTSYKAAVYLTSCTTVTVANNNFGATTHTADAQGGVLVDANAAIFSITVENNQTANVTHANGTGVFNLYNNGGFTITYVNLINQIGRIIMWESCQHMHVEGCRITGFSTSYYSFSATASLRMLNTDYTGAGTLTYSVQPFASGIYQFDNCRLTIGMTITAASATAMFLQFNNCYFGSGSFVTLNSAAYMTFNHCIMNEYRAFANGSFLLGNGGNYPWHLRLSDCTFISTTSEVACKFSSFQPTSFFSTGCISPSGLGALTKSFGALIAEGNSGIDIVATADLPVGATAQNGRILIEDNGAGDRNLILYAGGQRFRIDGGAAV